MTPDQIAACVRAYVRARDALGALYEEIGGAKRCAERKRERALKARIADAKAARAALRAAIGAGRRLFAKPRTRALDGVKVGFRKLPGRFEIADEAHTIERIRVRLPGREDELVRIKESVDRAALKTLSARELAAIGVALVEPDDEVVIATAPSDLAKKLDALLAEVAPEARGIEVAPKARGIEEAAA